MLALAGLDVRSDQVEMGCCGFSLIRDSVHLIFFTSEAFGGFVGVCVVQAKMPARVSIRGARCKEEAFKLGCQQPCHWRRCAMTMGALLLDPGLTMDSNEKEEKEGDSDAKASNGL